PNERALFAGKGIGESNGVSLRVESLGPGLLGVGDAAQILPRLPVEDIVEGVAVGGHQQLALLAVDNAIDQNRNLAGVPVVDVVRRELEMPLDLACGRV